MLALGVALLIRALPLADTAELPGAARDLVTLSLAVFIESLPFVLLGTFASILVQIWVPARWIERALPQRPVLRRAALSLLGVVLPVCECGNVPLARGLIARGFSPAEAITFLLAAPVLNPVTILTTYHAFGWESGILVARVLGGFAIANLLGWWLSTHPRQESLLTPGFRASCERDSGDSAVAAHGQGDHDHGHDHGAHDHGAHDHSAYDHSAHQAGGGRNERRLMRSAEAFLSEMGALVPALAIGSLLAGAIQVGVPRDVLIALGANPLWSVLALLALAFIVSICSSVDAFFILALSGSFLPGSIVGFLLFGAMTDVKMVALLRTTFTGKTIALLVGFTAASAAAIAWAVNLVG